MTSEGPYRSRYMPQSHDLDPRYEIERYPYGALEGHLFREGEVGWVVHQLNAAYARGVADERARHAALAVAAKEGAWTFIRLTGLEGGRFIVPVSEITMVQDVTGKGRCIVSIGHGEDCSIESVTESLDTIAAMLGGNHSEIPKGSPQAHCRTCDQCGTHYFERDVCADCIPRGVPDLPSPWHATADGLPEEGRELAGLYSSYNSYQPHRMKHEGGRWHIWMIAGDDWKWLPITSSPDFWAYFPEQPDVSSPPGRHEGTPMGETTPTSDTMAWWGGYGAHACDVRCHNADTGHHAWPSPPVRDPGPCRCVACQEKRCAHDLQPAPAEAKGEWTVERGANDAWWLCRDGKPVTLGHAAHLLNRKPMGEEELRPIVTQWWLGKVLHLGSPPAVFPSDLDDLARRIAEATCPPTN